MDEGGKEDAQARRVPDCWRRTKAVVVGRSFPLRAAMDLCWLTTQAVEVWDLPVLCRGLLEAVLHSDGSSSRSGMLRRWLCTQAVEAPNCLHRSRVGTHACRRHGDILAV
jgi:hypothetical protein